MKDSVQSVKHDLELDSEDEDDLLMELSIRRKQDEGGELSVNNMAGRDGVIASSPIHMLSPSPQLDSKRQFLNVNTARLSPISPPPTGLTPPTGQKRSKSITSVASSNDVSVFSRESSEANTRSSPIQKWYGLVNGEESQRSNVQNDLQSPVSMRRVFSTPSSAAGQVLRAPIPRNLGSSKIRKSRKRSKSVTSAASSNDASVSSRESSKVNILSLPLQIKSQRLSPVSMRSVLSTPNPAPDLFFRSLTKTGKLSTPIMRNRSKSTITNLSKPYDFRRHFSLPDEIEDKESNKPLISEDFRRSYSSDTSVVEEDVDKHSVLKDADLASPVKLENQVDAMQRSGTIFRSGTPVSQSSVGEQQGQQTNYLYTIGTGMTAGSDDDLLGESFEPPGLENKGLHLEAVSDHSESVTDMPDCLRVNTLRTILYLSVFASFGTLIRILVGRLFGFDCERINPINDWLTPMSKHICVTSSGMTSRYGGALFTDLPANMLGSFIMGLLTTLDHGAQPLPWLPAGHSLQKHTILHVSMKTGMCGSLTTFASWNSQMVAMLDGSKSVLGSQVGSALFGYIIGTMTAVACFVFGTHVSSWLVNARRARMIVSVDDRDHNDSSRANDVENPPHRINILGEGGKIYRQVKGFFSCGASLPFIIFAVVLVGCFVGDFIAKVSFYRFLWMDLALSPLGALLRWFLATRLNSASLWGRSWLPWGTLFANLSACILSILILSFEARYENYLSDRMWTSSLLVALRVGCAGSLSTVSTFAKELVDISKEYPLQAKSYYYGSITILGSMLVSLAIYAMVVRM